MWQFFEDVQPVELVETSTVTITTPNISLQVPRPTPPIGKYRSITILR
jgi:hypothetical protein